MTDELDDETPWERCQREQERREYDPACDAVEASLARLDASIERMMERREHYLREIRSARRHAILDAVVVGVAAGFVAYIVLCILKW